MTYDKLLFYELWFYKAHTQAQENWSVYSELNAQGNVHTGFRLANLFIRSSWNRLLPGKLTGPLLIRKFPAFYGTRRFITAFTSARYLSVYWATAILPMTSSYFLKVNYIIILPSTPKFSKWSFSLRSTHQIPLYNLYVSQMSNLPCPSHSF